MTVSSPPSPTTIRPVTYWDFDTLTRLREMVQETSQRSSLGVTYQSIVPENPWYRLLKFCQWFSHPLQSNHSLYVAENSHSNTELQGLIQVSPFNQSRSTWRVERVQAVNQDIGCQLLRHCCEKIWEARTWVLEANVNDKDTLAIYRHNGFQPLAQMTYWSIEPNLLSKLAENDPDLPNLLPVSNADAQLLYQLDCVSMPPLLRQVFDRNPDDFQMGFLDNLWSKCEHWFQKSQSVKGYIFEPQRKAAIGYFNLNLSLDRSRPHQGELTVHPAYTWLYPKLIYQMAQVVQAYSPQSLEVVSADYQHEREEYLTKSGAQPVEHTLLMSRSVWHKLKEVKKEGLQLSEVLQGLQPIPRTPIPSRISVSDMSLNSTETSQNHQFNSNSSDNGNRHQEKPE